jgi:TIR domain
MRIFISYRRQDCGNAAELMAQHLLRMKAVEQVFLDRESLAPGDAFRQSIADSIARSTHILVLIGKGWLGNSCVSSPPRISNSDDFVRMEVRLALNSGRMVIPLLVDEAQMPTEAELPLDIVGLTALNAFEIRSRFMTRDLNYMMFSLRGSSVARTDGPAYHTAIKSAFCMLVSMLFIFMLAIVNRLINGDDGGLVRALMVYFSWDEQTALGLVWLGSIGFVVTCAALPYVLQMFRRPWKM